MQTIGLGLVGAGLALRFCAIWVLGRFFTATVQVSANQALVTRGPYSRVRHPSYLGSLAAITGHALVLGAPVSAAGAALAMFLVYWRRMAVEEAALCEALGTTYTEYRARTHRLIPGVW
jgi:protein-S-isoprenylcysteine O-methyltransferase Ste14